jgi:hypothetical protein
VFKTSDFKISRPMYAVNLDAFSVGGPQAPFPDWGVVAAVWFRRKNRVTAACGGFLKAPAHQVGAPVDALDFLARYTDGRYGGDCVARWDGSTLWCLENENTRAEYKRLLVPMLEAYPAAPAGWDAWWWFG